MPRKVHVPRIPSQMSARAWYLYHHPHIHKAPRHTLTSHFLHLYTAHHESKTQSYKAFPMLSKVPNITKLYEELGIRNAPIYKAAEFVNQTRKWRKSYHTRSGQLAADLNHWNNLDVQ
jgi:hypothetical protein